MRCPATLSAILAATLTAVIAQDAAPADRNEVNTKATPGDMMADSPVTFPENGALPSKFPTDLRPRTFDSGEPGYYLFESPPRSLEQVLKAEIPTPYGRIEACREQPSVVPTERNRGDFVVVASERARGRGRVVRFQIPQFH